MKKKIAMRIASLALCVVFTGMLFGAPKSKAVVTETAIGTAAVASYFQATGLTMAASAGSTGALVTSGIADIAGSYAMATGVASSGSAFLSSVAAGVSISPAGAIVLTAAAVVAIGALVAWYVGENGLEATGDKIVALPGTSDYYSYNGHVLPSIDSVWNDKASLSYAVFNKTDGGVYQLFLGSVQVRANNNGSFYCTPVKTATYKYYCLDSSKTTWVYQSDLARTTESSLGRCDVWANYDIMYGSTIYNATSDPVPVGDNIENQLEILRAPEFTQPDTELDAESQKQLIIDAGFTAGTTLDTVAEQVPELIAAGTLTPTYEITTTETGEGADTESDPDEETGIYIPVLSDIKTRLSTLGDTIVDGIMDGLTSLFVPSEAYLEVLPQQITDTFEERTGFLTYPFSLLPNFVDRLSESSGDWILRWPQIVEPFTNTVLFQQGSFNVSSFIRSNGELGKLYELYRLLAKVFMSFGFLGLCYNKYRSVVGDDYGGL